MTSLSSIGSSTLPYRQNMFSRLDTDGDSKVSKEEFVSGRPSDVSETQASTLFDKMDSQGAGSLTEDQLTQGMEANKPSKSSRGGEVSDQVMQALMQLLQQVGGSTSQTTSDDQSSAVTAASGRPPSAADMFSAMDTDGNGSVSKAEFIAARPDDVSEEQATSLFDSIDTEETGSITESQFADSMQSRHASGPSGSAPPPPPPPPSSSASSSSTDTQNNLLAELLEAIKSYASSGYAGNSSQDLASSLWATA